MVSLKTSDSLKNSFHRSLISAYRSFKVLQNPRFLPNFYFRLNLSFLDHSTFCLSFSLFLFSQIKCLPKRIVYNFSTQTFFLFIAASERGFIRFFLGLNLLRTLKNYFIFKIKFF